ncbi:hypothetical protein B0H14DRAFT_3172519, partial [Mycena olivaceomarginata]
LTLTDSPYSIRPDFVGPKTVHRASTVNATAALFLDVGVRDGEVSSTSHALSSTASHGVSTSSHVAAVAPTHRHHNSNSTTHSASTSTSGARSEQVNTEEDPFITPLPGTHFDPSGAPPPPLTDKGKGRVGGAYAEPEGDNGFVDTGGEVENEDDSIDPVPPPVPAPVAKDRIAE